MTPGQKIWGSNRLNWGSWYSSSQHSCTVFFSLITPAPQVLDISFPSFFFPFFYYFHFYFLELHWPTNARQPSSQLAPSQYQKIWPFLFLLISGTERDSLLVRVLDSLSKGCEFESWQERWENFLLQSQFYMLTFIRCPFHPCVTAVTRKRPRSFCQKCSWQVTP